MAWVKKIMKSLKYIKLTMSILLFLIWTIGFSQNAGISGNVKDNNGKSIKDVSILLYSDSLHNGAGEIKYFNKYWLVEGAYSNDTGHYLIKPVPSGKFYIVALKHGYYIPEIKEIILTKNIRFLFDFELTKVKDSLELNNIPYGIYK